MKQALSLTSIGLILVSASAYVVPLLFAQQQPAINRQPKVAIVNIRAVFKENKRAKALQAELEEAIRPHKTKAEALSKEIDRMFPYVSIRMPKDAVFATNDEIMAKKRQWEAVNATILQLIEEKHKEKLPAVWTEVNEAIEAVAKVHGFQLVLGHGDPDDPDLRKFQGGTKASKLRTTDMGCTVATYVHGSVDITPIVIQTLKSR